MKPILKYPFKGMYRITFRFGEAPKWFTKVFGYPHMGVDFATPIGTPIRACYGGVIQYADNIPDSNGLGINIKHSWGLSQYWHLSRLTTKRGTKVETGQVIGISGDTGFATGPHLHFGIKIDGVNVPGMRGWCNPLPYIDGEPPSDSVPVVEPHYYRVRPGDTLWRIAQKFYKDGYQWRRIYKANSDKIRDPGLIYPFQELLIP